MHRVFQSFVDALADGADASSLHGALAELALAFEIPLFAYFSAPSRLNPTAWLVSNYPRAWTDRYLVGRFDRLDPVITMASGRTEPFPWSSGTRRPVRSKAVDGFFAEAAAHGIGRGFTVPIPTLRSSLRPAAVTFAAAERDAAFGRVVERHAAVLQLAAYYLHRHAPRLLSVERVIAGIRLTPREFQCLRWAAEGKSARDIGVILGVSRRTASFHLDNARAKLGVRSIQQAVALMAGSGAPR